MLRNALSVISAPLFIIAIYGGLFWCLSATLNDMTRAECTRGNQRACAALAEKR